MSKRSGDEEIRTRLQDLRSGRVTALPLHEVKKKIEAGTQVLKIELHPSADEELAAEVTYENKEPGLGRRFYSEVIAALDWIAANPELPKWRNGYRRIDLRVFPFYIAYTVEQGRVWVLAVAHARKRAGYWLERLT